MSTNFGKLSILTSFVLCLCFLFAFSPSTYAAALPGNGASLSISSTAVGLSFAGTSGNNYHYYLSLELPIGLSPSNLTFGTPTTARSITEYDFISYSGNCVTVDFYYKGNGSSYIWQLATLDSSFDLSESKVLTYGIVGVDQASMPTNTIFIYDKVLALRQWMNISHYADGVNNNLSLNQTPMDIRTYDYEAQNHYDVLSGDLTSVTLSRSPDITYHPLSSVELAGSLSLSSSFDILNDEWGQFVDRVSVCRWLSLSNPSFSQFYPGDYYFPTPIGQDMTVSFHSGYLYTNGMTPTYFTFLLDTTARPTSVSVTGCDLVTWSYSSGRLVLECKKDNASTDTSISLTNISITLTNLRSNYPLMKIQACAVGSFSTADMISNVESQENDNLISRGFSSIQSTLNNLFSGLTNGYNTSTSEDLNSLEEAAEDVSDTASTYVDNEAALNNFVVTDGEGNSSTLISHLENFNPSPTSFLELASAFGVVSGFANDIYNISGQYRFLITFTLTFGLILFILQIRRS